MEGPASHARPASGTVVLAARNGAAFPSPPTTICNTHTHTQPHRLLLLRHLPTPPHPTPTTAVGGNHEAANYLWELYYGGWAAPDIFFLGYAGVVRFGGVRIGGLSGIFKEPHYGLGHFERPPYHAGSMRSAYHIRELEVGGEGWAVRGGGMSVPRDCSTAGCAAPCPARRGACSWLLAPPSPST